MESNLKELKSIKTGIESKLKSNRVKLNGVKLTQTELNQFK